MKPLAKLYLNRQRLYEKTCEDAVDPLADTGAFFIQIKKTSKSIVTTHLPENDIRFLNVLSIYSIIIYSIIACNKFMCVYECVKNTAYIFIYTKHIN